MKDRKAAQGSIGLFIFIFWAILLPGIVLGEAFTPNDPYFSYNETLRPYYPGQWHLKNDGRAVGDKSNVGVDAGLKGAWDLGYTGKGIVIGIVDDGVEGGHEDIKANYSAALSRTFLKGSTLDATGPIYRADNHGTSVAGVAAARGGNGIGGTGAAPYATIADLRLLDDNVVTEDYINAYLWGSGVEQKNGKYVITKDASIQVKNHSYGKKYPWSQDNPNISSVINKSAENGVIHVWAAGNERGKIDEDASKNQTHANSNVITVAALGSNGKYSYYSNYSASVFVTAPSNGSGTLGIITTDRTGANLGYNLWSADKNPNGDQGDVFPDTNYCSDFGGTSSAAPLVAGIMALGKEANKYMDVRMAKHALVLTSTMVDPNDASATGGWVKNGAGYSFNPNYGFGNINAGKFVEKVKSIKGISAQTSYSTPVQPVNETIKYLDGNNAGGTSKQITIDTTKLLPSLRQPLEGVQVNLNFTHTKRGDLTAYITSPYGTKSRLFNSTTHFTDPKQQDDASVTDFGWTFLSNAFWGEDPLGGTDKSSGTWTIMMGDRVNKAASDLGTWNSYTLTLLMGKLLFDGVGVIVQTENINARSFWMQNAGDTFVNPKGYTLEVNEKVQLSAGEMNVNGLVKMSRPEDDEDEGEFILDGGIVSGGGTIEVPYGFYHLSGTIKPGNSIGTLSIIGDYYQEPQAKLLIEIASPTNNDILAITGGAYLSGILETSWQGGATPAIGTVFGAFLTATEGITGQFSSLLTNITPTVVFKPKYNIPNQVYLVVERDYINEVLLPYLNTNQIAVGTMLNSVGNTATGDLNTVLTAIDAIPQYNQIPGVYDQIAPRGGEAIFSMGISSRIFQSANVSERLSDVRRGVRGANLDGAFIRNSDFIREGRDRPILLASAGPDMSGMLPSGADEKWGVFIKGNAVSADQRDTPDQAGYSFTSAGATLGMDWRFTGSLAAGLFVGYSGSRADVDNNGSKVKMDGYTLGAYGTWYKSGFFLDGQASYGWSDYRNTRRIVFPGIDRTATSKPGGRQLTLYGGAGYELNINKWMIVPTLSLQYIDLVVDGFTESGANSLNLAVDSQGTQSLLGYVGGKVYYTFDTAKSVIMPGIRASYGYEFLRGGQTVTSRLAQGSSPFSIETPSRDGSSFLVGAMVSMFLKNMPASFHIGYDAQIGTDQYIAHSINGAVKISF